jgi:glutamine synthetase
MNDRRDHDQDAADVLRRLQDSGVRTLVIGGSDTHGVMRGKRVPIEQVPYVLEHGMALCDVFWVLHIDDSDRVLRPAGHRGYFPNEAQGYPDIVAVPDLTTVRSVPWHPDTALAICDWQRPHDQGAVPIAPRSILRGVVERATHMGFTPFSALELEFYVLDEPTGTEHRKRSAELVPLQERPSTYGVVSGSHLEHIGALVRDHMIGFGLPIEACNAETGPGQFEINLRYRESLTAADDAFLFKSGVKEVAAQSGWLATFMAKPNSDWAGNSCHIHMSLRDGEGRGVFFDPDGENGVSRVMRHFAGGVLATMREFTAIMAPTPNSYRRYSPYSWAGSTATWGIDNRSVGLRAIVEGEAGTRLEHRQAGGDVNPYLASAVVLAGGLHGIANAIEPTDLVDHDVYARPADTVPGLPGSLEVAIGELERSEVARDWLGDDFVDHFVVMKRAELDAQAQFVTDWEVSRYLEPL